MMPPDEVAIMFRKSELQRRELRRIALEHELKSLIKRMDNEGMLLHEILTPEEQKIHALANKEIIRQQLAFEREASPGYWTRLWRALLNK